MKPLAKILVNAVFVALAFLPALLAGFGRFEPGYTFFAHVFALVPGVPGDAARRAYYYLTLRSCSLRSCISFGTFFSRREAVVGEGVYIGAYCVIGRATIGARTQIACNVQIPSGRHQHARSEQGGLLGAEQGSFRSVTIGADCWIGTSAIVMADVGDGTTIGAGSVVTKDIEPRVVAVGNPARVIKPTQGN